MKLAGYLVLFLYLLVMSFYDIKKREIQIGFSALAAVLLLVGQLICIFQGKLLWCCIPAGMIPGGFLIGLSWFSKGQVGIGDGIVFVVSGIFLGFFETGVLLFLSLLFAAFSGGILLVLKRLKRKDSLPFVPFIFAGYGVICLWKLLG